jgi:cytochrome c biogenesis protein CcdA
MQEIISTIKSMLNSAGYGPVSIAFSFVLGTLSAIASACCTLPLMGAVAGYSITQDDNRQKALQSALFFMAGAVAALLVIGWIIIFFGQSAIRVSGGYWKIAAGSIALLFGIGSLRLFPFAIPKLPFITSGNKSSTLVSGFSGMIFGGTIVVTSLPCNPGIFIILGAAVLEKHIIWAFTNLFAYAIGFSAPLSGLVLGLSFGKSAMRLQKTEKIVRTAAGILLIATAFYLFYTY